MFLLYACVDMIVKRTTGRIYCVDEHLGKLFMVKQCVMLQYARCTVSNTVIS